MNLPVMLKTLSLAALVSLSLVGSAAQAGGCLPGLPFSPAPGASCPTEQAGKPSMEPSDARPALLRERIEMGLRTGQLTPWEAGRLMRAQWEMEQFRRGFLAGGQVPQGQACASRPDLGAMAASGVQTASTVMRAIMKEATRIIQEQAAAEDLSL